MIPKISEDEYDRDRRITNLERQVTILVGQIAARDAAIVQLLREVVAIQADAATDFVAQYPQMLTEIDAKVLDAITSADEDEKVQS